jgi:hypothetical protein
MQEEARARAEATAKAQAEQRRKQEEARAAAAEAARKKQVCCFVWTACACVWCGAPGLRRQLHQDMSRHKQP